MCDCKICIVKTFASNEKSKYWSAKNVLQPNQVFKSVATKFWFDCTKCGMDFESKLCHVTDGSWCPYCVNKTELILFDTLHTKYNTLECQFKVAWCKDIKYYPFDFVIKERKL
jgi:DNA-directed RNA polymerase subunit RPC12/RpoP